MKDYIFICEHCYKVLRTDMEIELHSECCSSNSGKYWLEEYILENIEDFIQIQNERKITE